MMHEQSFKGIYENRELVEENRGGRERYPLWWKLQDSEAKEKILGGIRGKCNWSDHIVRSPIIPHLDNERDSLGSN